MKIKITLDNNAAINSELDKVNGRATAFTITCTKELLDIVAEAEKKLSILPKADRKGAAINYRPAGPSANSYKYAAKSTRVTCERGASGWFLTGVFESEVQPKRPALMDIMITPAQAAEIQRRAVEPFTVLA
jgi:hypothetical protein